MQFHNFFRGGTSHRIRIALNLKGLSYDYVAVDLRKNAHHAATFKSLNPQGLVPTLVDGDLVLSQSEAITHGWKSATRRLRCCPPASTTAHKCEPWQRSWVAIFTR
jgi:hypothetical protein